jgi:glutamyl-tRNA synthetase/glutamyl-Q tRNA(Asp) synthetase
VRLKLEQERQKDHKKSVSPVQFRDLFLGNLEQNPAEQVGDVVIKDRFGQWTYQFAVVIDDLEQQINLIIRGQDLLSSTGRQLAMRSLIDSTSITPVFAHHPLLLDDDGQKLAKRRSSEAISYLRRMGLSADEVRGLAAFMGGLIPDRRPISATDELDLKMHPT